MAETPSDPDPIDMAATRAAERRKAMQAAVEEHGQDFAELNLHQFDPAEFHLDEPRAPTPPPAPPAVRRKQAPGNGAV